MIRGHGSTSDASSKKAWKGVWKVAVASLGFLLVAAGAAMLVLPGPGLLVLLLGLAVLGSEFLWAKKLLHRLNVKLKAGKEHVRATLRYERKTSNHSTDHKG